MIRKFISFVLSSVIIVSAFTSSACFYAEEELPFSDVEKGSWYYEAVRTSYVHDIMNGRSEDEFASSEQMTRAEIITMLSRLASADVSETEDMAACFSDLKKSDWYYSYVGFGVFSGLVDGYDDGTFRGENKITRAELATTLSRFLDYMDLEIRTENTTIGFKDDADIAGWAKEYVEKIRQTGLMIGDDNGNFNPKSSATRAELATLASRLIPYLYEKRIEQRDALLTISSETITDEKIFADLISEKIDSNGFFDEVLISNYNDVKVELEKLSNGKSADVTVDAIFAKRGMKIASSYIVSVTIGTPDSSDMLKPDGGVLEFFIKGEFPAEDVFAQWIKEDADKNNVYDSVVLLDFNTVKLFAERLSIGEADSLDVAVKFSNHGEKDVFRTYSVQFMKPDPAVDPNPDNVGVMYEENGVKMSELIDV